MTPPERQVPGDKPVKKIPSIRIVDTSQRFSERQGKIARAAAPPALWGLVYALPNGGIKDVLIGGAVYQTVYTGVKAWRQHEIKHDRRAAYDKEKLQRDKAWDAKQQEIHTGMPPAEADRGTTIFAVMRESMRNRQEQRRSRKDYIRDPEGWRAAWDERYERIFREETPFTEIRDTRRR